MTIPFEGGFLRALVPSDASAIAELINDRSVWRQLRDLVPRPYSVADGEAFIARVHNDPPSVLAIESNQRLAGVIGAYGLSDVERFGAELGYWLGSPFQGKGIATRALLAFVPYIFKSSMFTRLQANVFEGNHASMRVLSKCGFTPEGILRKAVMKDGRALDMHVFGLLKEEGGSRKAEK